MKEQRYIHSNLNRNLAIKNYGEVIMAIYMSVVILGYYSGVVELNILTAVIPTTILGSWIILHRLHLKTIVKRQYETNGTPVIYYKYARINWLLLIGGAFTVLNGIEIESSLKIWVLCWGVFGVLFSTLEYVFGIIAKTNIIAVTKDSLIDLNGKVLILKYNDINEYKIDEHSIVLYEQWKSHKLNLFNFKRSEELIGLIEERLNNNSNSACDNTA